MFRIVDLNTYRILGLLAALRLAAAVAQAGTVVMVDLVFGWSLPVATMLAMPAALLVWNLFVWWRLRRWRFAAPAEVVAHLAVDVAALTALLWLAGGPGNPFVSLYLLPIALAAASLPMAYAWTTAGLCALAYTTMLGAYLWRTGLPGQDFFQWHVVGMWVNFLIGGLLLTGALSALAGILRRRDAALAAAREQALRDERIVATGTLAAGAAHELNTPLSTMSVLVGELRESTGPEAAEDLDLLAEQIAHCKRSLNGLLAAAEPASHGAAERQSLRQVLREVFDRWRLMRPETRLEVAFDPDWLDAEIVPDPMLAQALSNLFNNAADASAETGAARVAVRCAADGETLTITIDDQGPGVSDALMATAGRRFVSTKPDGLGMGLVLSNASIGQLGGEVRLFARPEGGSRTQVSLPLAGLQPGADDAA